MKNQPIIMRNSIKLSLFFCFLITTSFAFGQKFIPSTIELQNGEQISGLVNAKSINGKSITFKKTENSEKESIESSLCKSIKLSSGDKVYELENLTYYTSAKKNKTSSSWMIKLVSGYYNLYSSNSYSIDKNGDISLKIPYYVGATTPDFIITLKNTTTK